MYNNGMIDEQPTPPEPDEDEGLLAAGMRIFAYFIATGDNDLIRTRPRRLVDLE